MAATATIVRSYKDDVHAFMCATVLEAGDQTVEYCGCTPLLKADGSTKTDAELKTELKTDMTADIKMQRDAQLATDTIISGITGPVTV